MLQVANEIFEAAVDAVIDGEVATLRTLLARHPALPQARSARAHHATLLHHVAANGVEDERQRTPSNAVEAAWQGRLAMIDALVSHGAPLEEQNEHGGTVLDSTVWFARNAPEPGVDYLVVIRRLLRAGADRGAVPRPTGDAAIDALLAAP